MKRALSFGLALIALASLAWVATPVVLIRPFGAQTPRGLALSYAMRGRSASLTLGLLAAGLVVAALLWPRLMSRRGRILAGVAIVGLGGLAWFARHNHFEWMFRPLPHPEFLIAGAAEDVTKDDLVLGVAAGNEARAYPVRALAYHHVVNDAIGGEPIVATY
jgi:MFS family permease